MTAFQVLQIAVGVLLGNIMTRCLFRAWDSIKAEDDTTFSVKTALFYLAPLGLIVLVMTGSGTPR